MSATTPASSTATLADAGGAPPHDRARSLGQVGVEQLREQAAVEQGRVTAPAAPGRDHDVGRPLLEARGQRPHRGARHQRVVDRADGRTRPSRRPTPPAPAGWMRWVPRRGRGWPPPWRRKLGLPAPRRRPRRAPPPPPGCTPPPPERTRPAPERTVHPHREAPWRFPCGWTVRRPALRPAGSMDDPRDRVAARMTGRAPVPSGQRMGRTCALLSSSVKVTGSASTVSGTFQ